MEQVRGVFGVSGKGISAEPGTAAEIGREKRSNEFAGEAEALHVVVFEGYGIESTRNRIAFVLRRREFRSGFGRVRIPAEKFGAQRFVDGSIGEFLADGIDEPNSGLGDFRRRRFAKRLREARPKPEAVIARAQSGGIVRSAADGQFGRSAVPMLVIELRLREPDGVVELGEKTVRILNEVDGGALVRDEALAVDEKFVLLGFAAED